MRLDPARQEATVIHLQSCPSCAALAERHRAMSVALRRLAHDRAVPATNGRQLQTLLASFDAATSRPRRTRVSVTLSLAASVLIVVGLCVGWKSDVPPHPASPIAAATTAPPINVHTAFVVLPGARALPRLESGAVIRVNLPAPDGSIEADVLVGQDGLVRAVRLLE
jgi:anti-sigma factor RsiW